MIPQINLLVLLNRSSIEEFPHLTENYRKQTIEAIRAYKKPF